MTQTTTLSLAELISMVYEEFLAIYEDEDLASVAAAATINDLLAERALRAGTQDKVVAA